MGKRIRDAGLLDWSNSRLIHPTLADSPKLELSLITSRLPSPACKEVVLVSALLLSITMFHFPEHCIYRSQLQRVQKTASSTAGHILC